MLQSRNTILPIFLLVLFLIGCSGKSPVKQTKISFMFWGNARELQLISESIKGFENLHFDINVQVIHVTESYYDKMNAMVAGNSLPDLCRISESYIGAYAEKDIFLDLKPRMGSLTNDEFHPKSLVMFTYKEKLIGLPESYLPVVLYFNLDLFDKYGIVYPNTTWTWDTFREVALRLTKRDNDRTTQYGIMVHPEFFFWVSFLWQSGAEFMDETGTVWALGKGGNRELTFETLQFITGLIHKDRVAGTIAEWKTMQPDQRFMSGLLGMFISGPWHCLPYSEIKRFKWGIAELPRSRLKAVFAGGSALCIAKSSKHPDAAWELARFMTNSENQKKMAEKGFLMPTRESVLPYFMKGNADLETGVFARSIPYCKTFPPTPEWFKIKGEIFDREIENCFVGVQNFEETIERIDQQVRQIGK